VAAAASSGSVDAIFSSPLERAYRTALIIDGKVGCGVVVVDELAEVHHGAFAGLTNDEIEALHPGELLRRERQKYVWRFPGGESYADADGRALVALERVAGSGAVTPLLVTHEMLGRMLLRTLLELSPDEAFKLSIPHGAVVNVIPRQQRLTISDDLSRGDP
jgi:broad specificity phosphatase PhoE